MATELKTLQDIRNSNTLNPDQAARLKELEAAGSEGHPAGIQAAGSPLKYVDVPGYGIGPDYSQTGAQATQNQSLNLTELYDRLHKDNNISGLEGNLSNLTKQYTELKAGINDNPFLSEATRVGRVAKAETLFNERTANIRGDIATKKADIETRLNLATKQFDINNTVTQQAVSQFNTLLSSGALDNAPPETIAELTRKTGMSSATIYAAIAASRKKTEAANAEANRAKTEVMKFDDGDNQGYVVVNTQTGAIVKKEIIAASAPTATEQKAAAGGGKSTGSGSGGSSIKKTEAVSIAKTGLKNVDKNKDKLVSVDEFTKVVQDLMNHGASYEDAVTWAAEAMSSAGYKQWKW